MWLPTIKLPVPTILVPPLFSYRLVVAIPAPPQPLREGHPPLNSYRYLWASKYRQNHRCECLTPCPPTGPDRNCFATFKPVPWGFDLDQNGAVFHSVTRWHTHLYCINCKQFPTRCHTCEVDGWARIEVDRCNSCWEQMGPASGRGILWREVGENDWVPLDDW